MNNKSKSKSATMTTFERAFFANFRYEISTSTFRKTITQISSSSMGTSTKSISFITFFPRQHQTYDTASRPSQPGVISRSEAPSKDTERNSDLTSSNDQILAGKASSTKANISRMVRKW